MSQVWSCGRFELALDRPLVMGILNVTPDSFSDGGEHEEPLEAIAWARRMIAEGADIVDIGGESTRPGAREVTPAEELSRVRPVVGAAVADAAVPVSVDTRHVEVARACLREGADILNDVSGFRDDSMVATAAESSAGIVVMHMLGEPGTMQEEPRYDDVVDEVRGYLDRQALRLVKAGVDPLRIAVDPGIGFGKTLEHNLELLRRLGDIAELGYPVVVGASRKRFVGEVTGVEVPRERSGGSVAAAVWACMHGARVVRVHDVAATAQALAVIRALGGRS